MSGLIRSPTPHTYLVCSQVCFDDALRLANGIPVTMDESSIRDETIILIGPEGSGRQGLRDV
jgi:hypothetical protein